MLKNQFNPKRTLKPWIQLTIQFYYSILGMEPFLGFTLPDTVSIAGDYSFSGHKLVPWISWDDWRFVKDGLFSSSPNLIASSLRRVSFNIHFKVAIIIAINIFLLFNCVCVQIICEKWLCYLFCVCVVVGFCVAKQGVYSGGCWSYSFNYRDSTEGSFLKVQFDFPCANEELDTVEPIN